MIFEQMVCEQMFFEQIRTGAGSPVGLDWQLGWIGDWAGLAIGLDR